jgi:hypothetical protein
MGFIKDIEDEFNASNNNTTEKYNNNELFTLTSINTKENFTVKKKITDNIKNNLKKDAIKVTKTLNRNKGNIFNFLLTLFGGIFAQIFFRIANFEGSLDKWWLLLPIFWFPPLSIIPSYYLSRKKLKKGNNKIAFFNLKTILAVSGVFIGLLLRTFSKNIYIDMISQIIPLLTLFAAYYFKDCKKCIDDTGNKKKQIVKTGYSALLALSISIIMHITMQFINNNIPTLRDFTKPLYNSDLASSIIFSVNIYLSYLIVNCLNNTTSEFKYCRNRNLRKQIIPLTIIGTFLVFIKGFL